MFNFGPKDNLRDIPMKTGRFSVDKVRIPNEEEYTIIKAGAMWMLMNIECGNPFSAGAKAHMNAINSELHPSVPNIIPLYKYCRTIYAQLGERGLELILDRKLPFQVTKDEMSKNYFSGSYFRLSNVFK